MMKILLNKVRCNLCGEEIESKSTHHFVFCKCKSVGVDGGLDYLKRTAPTRESFSELSIINNDDSDEDDSDED